MILAGPLKIEKFMGTKREFMLMTTHQSVHVSAFYDALVAFTSPDTTKTAKLSHRTFRLPATPMLIYILRIFSGN
jgi:hypothetical protein